MGTSTFTGPLRSGNILNTSGTTVGKDVKNVGSVELAQTAKITQSTSLSTEIVIPAGSTIINVDALVTTAWSGADTTFRLYDAATSGTPFTSAIQCSAIGKASSGNNPGVSAPTTAIWINTGASDTRVFANSANDGSGAGVLIVRYLQAQGIV